MKITPKILILKSLKPLIMKHMSERMLFSQEWPNNYLNKI